MQTVAAASRPMLRESVNAVSRRGLAPFIQAAKCGNATTFLESEMDIPMIVYWKDAPLSEMPRDELEREFIAAWQKIGELERERTERSVAHIKDLVKMRMVGR
jgi:uncharacterized NAD(P)/FAD-binding protein YdhS